MANPQAFSAVWSQQATRKLPVANKSMMTQRGNVSFQQPQQQPTGYDARTMAPVGQGGLRQAYAQGVAANIANQQARLRQLQGMRGGATQAQGFGGGSYGQQPSYGGWNQTPQQANPTGQQSFRGYEQWAPSYSYANQGPSQIQVYNPMQNWNPNAGPSYANQWGQALQNTQGQFNYPTWNQVQQAGDYYSQQPNQAISGILGGFAQNQQSQQAAVQAPTAYDSQYQAALANSQRYAPGTPERTQADNALKMLQGRMEHVYQQRQAQYGPSSFGGSYGYHPAYGGYSPTVAYAGPEITSQYGMNQRYR